MFWEKPQNQNPENGQNKIYFQVPKTSHHHRKSVGIRVLVKIPIPQILPLRIGRNVLRNILSAESAVEILHPLHPEKAQSENFEQIIEEEKKCHENHICNLQFQQSVKGFFNISS